MGAIVAWAIARRSLLSSSGGRGRSIRGGSVIASRVRYVSSVTVKARFIFATSALKSVDAAEGRSGE